VNPQILRTSPITAVVLLHATLTLSAFAPAAARADALDHWTRSQVSTNPMGYMGIMLRGIAYANGRYVAVGTYAGSDTGMIQTSEDGVHWTMRSPQDDSILELYDVAYGNGKFAAVGWGYFVGGRNLYDSTNGINWTSHTNATVSNFYRVTYGGGLFVAVGDGLMPDPSGILTNRNIYTSPDGITWTGRNSGAPAGDVHSIRDVAYGAGRFVAVDDAGYVYLSTTGTTWTRQLPPVSLSGYMNCWNGIFIASSTTGTNFVSSDGSSWSPMVKDVTNAFSRVVYARGYYAALSGTNLFASTNGTNWVQRNLQSPTNANWSDLAFGCSNLVVIGWTYPPLPMVPIASVSDPFAGLAIQPGFPPRLAISGLQGCPYRIEGLDVLDPHSNNWQPLATFSLTNSPLVWTDTTASGLRRFYRAVLLP
jgi:hypothetical protein